MSMPSLSIAGTSQEEQNGPALDTLRIQLLDEIDVMLRHAWANGLDLCDDIVESLALLQQADAASHPGSGDASLPGLAKLHGELVKVVAPALPSTLRQFSSTGNKSHGIWGPIRNVRLLMATAAMFTLAFIALSASPRINDQTMSGSAYALDGWEQLIVMTFLLVSAGIGAVFQALFTAQRYVSSLRYDTRYDSSYWLQVGLGLFSGFLLADVIPLDAISSSHVLVKPVLALLGGFSSALLYRILQRLADTAEYLILPRAPR